VSDIAFEIGGLFISAFISSTIAPGGSEAVLAYMAAAGHYQVGLLVAVATIGNTLGAMTTWGLGVLAAKKFPAATLLPEKKTEGVGCCQKQRYLDTVFYLVAGGWGRLVFRGRMAKTAILSGLFNHIAG